MLWPNFLLLFELKTEKGSIRKGQVDEQLELALHNYPGHRVALIYVTKDAISGSPPLTERSSYANVTWQEVAPLIHSVWSSDDGAETAIATLFAEYLTELSAAFPKSRTSVFIQAKESDAPAGEPAVASPEETDKWISEALLVALEVERAKEQRAMAIPLQSPKEAQRFRELVREFLREYNIKSSTPITHALPWVWQSTSPGAALTDYGRQYGVELRFSYYQAGNGL